MKLDDLTINKLVEAIQYKLEDVPIDRMLGSLNKCEFEFTRLLEALERYGERFISRWITIRHAGAYLDKEDIWQDFITKRLLTAVKTFNIEKETKFTTYLSRPLAQQCEDAFRRVRSSITNEFNGDTQEEMLAIPCPRDILSTPERKVFLLAFLEEFCSILNNLKTKEEKILVYHCNKLLDEALHFNSANSTINEWRGLPLEDVAESAESAYAEIVETATRLMSRISARLKSNNNGSEIFLNTVAVGDKPKINEWIRQVKDLLMKHHKNEISKIFSNLTECIN